jgi:WD40 repeat protein
MADTADIAPPRAEVLPRPPRAETAPPPSPVDTTSPYLGLRSFAEADRELFHGREAETDELFHLVQRETLSVVFGMSGLGKSSLLRAGLFPRLRAANLFPIAVRLTYGASDLVAQIRTAIAREIAERDVDASPPPDEQTLWEYFHRTPFWSARNRPLVPVIVLDQFEELFTLGQGSRGRGALLTELGDLIENRIPEAVRRTSDADALPPTFQVPKAKVILSLREDYLARLEDLRATIPSIARGRFRLRSMDGTQAVHAVRHERTEHLVDAAVAERIVRFVAGAHGEGPADTALDTLAVEPALLSLVCRQLDDIRALRKEPTISADLLTGESARILDDFYERSIADLDPRIMDHIEEHLLTPDGHRTTVAMSNLASIAGMAPAVAALIDRRILRIEERLGRPHVEVIHDVLTRVMVARRDRRRSDRERRRRSRRRIATLAALSALVALAVGIVLYLGARQRLAAEADEQRAAIEAERRANAQRSAHTLVVEASTMLSRNDAWAAARVLKVAYGITGKDSPPELAMLVKRFTALDAMLALVLQPTSRITAIAFSGDGTKLFAGHEDGSVSIWSTKDWKLTTLARSTAEPAPEPTTAGASPTDAAVTISPSQPSSPPVRGLAVNHDGRYLAVSAEFRETVWDTTTQTMRGSGDAYLYDPVQVSADGSWTVLIDNDGDNWLMNKRGGRWRASLPSDTCRVTAAAGDAERRRSDLKDVIRLGLSGDGSTLASYRQVQYNNGWAAELSVFSLKGPDPEQLASQCVPARAGVIQLMVNFDGTAIALSRTGPCPSPNESCSSTSVIYRRTSASKALQAMPMTTQVSFDSLRPELVLGTAPDELSFMTLDGATLRMIANPCRSALMADMVNGRLAATGCGRFVVAEGGDSIVAGDVPFVSDDTIRISAAARLAATVSPDGTLRVWRLDTSGDRVVRTSSPTTIATPLASIQPFTIGPPPMDGALVVSRDGKTVIASALDVPEMVSQFLRAPDPRRITLGIFDATDQTLKPVDAVMEHPPGATHEHGVSHVELSADQQSILSVGRDRHARVWKRDGSRVLDLGDGATEPIHYATFSPDGHRIATLGRDRTCVWDTGGGRKLHCAGFGAGRNLVFDGAGTVFVGDSDGSVKRWDTATLAATPIGRHAQRIERLDVDGGGHWIASAGADALRVWDLHRCTPGGCAEVAHVKDVLGFEQARFVPANGKIFVLGVGRASRAHVIDLEHPDADAILPLAAGVQDIDVSTDGRILLCELTGNVEEWDLGHRRLTGRLQLDAAHEAFRWCAARYLAGGRIVTRFTDGSLAMWPASALAAGLVSPDTMCEQWATRGLECEQRKTISVFYSDHDSVFAYDGDLVRLFAAASGKLVAAARSETQPLPLRDGTLIVPRAGQLVVVGDSGETHLQDDAPASTPAGLAYDRNSGQLFSIDHDLGYRLIDDRLQLGPQHALASKLPHGARQAIAFAPSGRWMLLAWSDGTLTQLDADGREGRSLSFPGGAHVIVPAIHGDGLLAIGDDAVVAWRADAPPKVIKTISGLSGRAAAWDMAADAIIVAGHDGLVRLELASGRQVWRNEAPSAYLHDVTWIDLDGQQLKASILVAALDHMALFSLDDGHLLREFPDRAVDPQVLAGSWFVEPGLLLTSTHRATAELWDIHSGRRLFVEPRVWDIAAGPAGKFIVKSTGPIGIAHIQDHKLVVDARVDCRGFANAGAWSLDGRWIAIAIHSFGAGHSANDKICLWNAVTSQVQAMWPSGARFVTGLALSHDGSRLLLEALDRTTLWNTQTRARVTELERERLVTTAFIGGKPYIVTGDQTATIRIYDAGTGKPVAELPGMIVASAITETTLDERSGLLAIADDDGRVVVVDIGAGKRMRDLPPVSEWPHDASFAPGGGSLAIAFPKSVQLWSSLSQVAVPPTTLDVSSVAATSFSPDGQWLATAASSAERSSSDVHLAGNGDAPASPRGILTIWNVADGTQIISFATEVPLTAVSWSRDGRYVVVGGNGGFIKTFDLSREPQDSPAVAKILDRLAPRALSASIRMPGRH